MSKNAIADAIDDAFTSSNEANQNFESANIVDAVYQAARIIARSVDRLGNADAATPMGALEAHGLAIHESAKLIAGALSEVAEAINNVANSRL